MLLLFFVRNFFRGIIDQLSTLYRVSLLQKANPSCRIHYSAKILLSELGGHNVIFSDVIINESSLGAHTYVQKGTVISFAKIGRFCSIASGVTIGPGIHNMEGVSTHPAFYLRDTPLATTFSPTNKFVSNDGVSIGHDVWVGQNAVILDGVIIGTGAIVAAGAVVTKNVPPYSIVGGVPAKVIRKRFDDKICEQLLNSAWWNLPDEYFREHHDLFDNPAAFLSERNK